MCTQYNDVSHRLWITRSKRDKDLSYCITLLFSSGQLTDYRSWERLLTRGMWLAVANSSWRFDYHEQCFFVHCIYNRIIKKARVLNENVNLVMDAQFSREVQLKSHEKDLLYRWTTPLVVAQIAVWNVKASAQATRMGMVNLYAWKRW